MSIILCQRLDRRLPSFQGRNRDGRTKKMTIPIDRLQQPTSRPFPSALCPFPSAFPFCLSLLPSALCPLPPPPAFYLL
jgi:hypothetical protein